MNPNRAFRRSENRKNSGKSVFFGALTFCLLALGFLTLFLGVMGFSTRGTGSALSAQEAAVDLSQGTAQNAAQDSADGAGAFDVTIYASPIKMVQTQSSERILNSAEWTEFYLNLVGKFDETRLRKEPASPLMTQLDRTFGKSPCSSNDLLNLAFFNLQGIWLNLTLAPNLALQPSAPFLTLVSDFAPAELSALSSALLAETGYTPPAEPGGAFQSPAGALWFLAQTAPLPFDVGKSALYLARDAETLAAQKERFLASEETRSALGNQDRVFFLLSLSRGGIDKIAAYFAALPSDSPLLPFAPGIAELAKRTKTVWLSIQETGGVTVFTMTIYSQTSETTADLSRLFGESKKILEQGVAGKELSPAVALAVDMLGRAEFVQEDERFYVVFKLVEEETFAKIQQWILSLKGGFENRL